MAKNFMNSFVNVVSLRFIPRLHILRVFLVWTLVVALSSIDLVQRGEVNVSWTCVLVVMFLHHVASAFSCKYFYAFFDLIMTIAETIALFFYSKQLQIEPLIPEIDAIHYFVSWMVFACLIIMSLQRLGTALSQPKGLFLPYDILVERRPNIKSVEEIHSVNQIFMGKKIWKGHYVGETGMIKFMRGFLGICFLFGIAVYFATAVLFEPIRETAFAPLKELRTTTWDPNMIKIDFPATWNIVATLPNVYYPPILNDPSNYVPYDWMLGAIDVVLLQDSQIEQPQFPCTTVHSSFAAMKSERFPAVQCPNGTSDMYDNSFLPTLLITVNFTNIAASHHRFSNRQVPAINILPGMANQTQVGAGNVVYSASGISVVPGVNLIATLRPDVRQVYLQPMLAAFGIFQTSKTFWVPRVTSIYHDPSTSVLRGDNISTLVLFVQEDFTALRILSDYRSNSAVEGFSAVGGLWTALSGVFAVLFGGSLIHVMYGSKSLSLGGMAHTFQHEAMKDACLRKYPAIIKEKDEKDRDLVDLIRDHYIDLSFLESPKKPDCGLNRTDEGRRDKEKVFDEETGLKMGERIPKAGVAAQEDIDDAMTLRGDDNEDMPDGSEKIKLLNLKNDI